MKSVPDWLDRDEYPFQSRYFKTPAGKMHYVDEGRGNPLVFIHGNPAWSFLYRRLISSLSGKFRCIAPDHIGFGLSEKPFHWSYLPEDHAKNLQHLLDHLQVQNITLVVNDWGGPIGLSYALSRPEKVDNLVLSNTWLWPVNRELHYVAFSLFMGGPVGRLLIRKFNFFARSVVKKSFGERSRLTPEIHHHYLRPLEAEEDRKGCWVFPGEIIRSTPWLRKLWSHHDILKRKKILIVWGMKDIAFREKELLKWQQAFPKAHVVRFADAGHFVAEEKGDEFSVAIENFLLSASSQARLF